MLKNIITHIPVYTDMNDLPTDDSVLLAILEPAVAIAVGTRT